MRIIILFLNTSVIASMRLVIITVVSAENSASIFRTETVLKNYWTLKMEAKGASEKMIIV